MFDIPYGGATGGQGSDIMSMLSSLFKGGGQQGTSPGGSMSGMGLMQNFKPMGFLSMMQGQNGQQAPQMQTPQQVGASSVNSNVNKILDPNSKFMLAALGKNPSPSVDPNKTIGAPISNSPATNMQNGGVPPFMQMPWQRQQ